MTTSLRWYPDSQSTLAHLNHLREARGRGAAADYRRLRICALRKVESAMSYFDLGHPDGTPLLCLHGLSVTGLYFNQFHDYFVARRIRAIAPCLLGGVSIADSSKTVGHLSTELIELLDALGIDRFDVVGFSWGTLPLLALLAAVPARIRRAGLLGPMLPTRFLDSAEVGRMKSDVRTSLAMVRHLPAVHRWVMALVGRLPASVLVNQFRDANLSMAEAQALAAGAPFTQHLSHCIDECRRSGSQFFTHGWRMFLEEPGYALSDLASPALRANLHLYVGERDNVHLPSFAKAIAAARSGIDVAELERRSEQALPGHDARAGPYRQIFSTAHCGIWMAPGAGRLACILYLKDAVEHLLSSPGPQS